MDQPMLNKDSSPDLRDSRIPKPARPHGTQVTNNSQHRYDYAVEPSPLQYTDVAALGLGQPQLGQPN